MLNQVKFCKSILNISDTFHHQQADSWAASKGQLVGGLKSKSFLALRRTLQAPSSAPRPEARAAREDVSHVPITLNVLAIVLSKLQWLDREKSFCVVTQAGEPIEEAHIYSRMTLSSGLTTQTYTLFHQRRSLSYSGY